MYPFFGKIFRISDADIFRRFRMRKWICTVFQTSVEFQILQIPGNVKLKTQRKLVSNCFIETNRIFFS